MCFQITNTDIVALSDNQLLFKSLGVFYTIGRKSIVFLFLLHDWKMTFYIKLM